MPWHRPKRTSPLAQARPDHVCWQQLAGWLGTEHCRKLLADIADLHVPRQAGGRVQSAAVVATTRD